MASNPPASTTTTTTEVRPILRLRSKEETASKKKKNGVKWDEDVVDNEHMNKKKTKICCIFHPQREFGESSSDESSDSSSDSSGDEGKDHKCCKHANSPNAYEKQPKYKNRSSVPKKSQS